MNVFFPVHRPSTGLSFTERGIALVELRRGWQKPGIARIIERPLPEGVLALSSSEPNVKDREALVRELRALVATSSERTVAVCLPDRVCHLAVFPFETLPTHEREREQIIRWRFQHEEHVTVGDARIMHRVFSVKGAMVATQAGVTTGGQVTAYVVALAIKRSVLEQYELVCQEAGLLPLSISCAALWLFDFYRPAITQANELFFVHQASDSMTFIAIRQGLPVFCRMKAQRPGSADRMSEIWSTLQFYEDLHPHGETGTGSGSVPIYMVGEGSSQKGMIYENMADVSSVTTRKQEYISHPTVLPDWKTIVSTKHGTISSERGLYALACAGGR
jgi:hypothetical protein